MCNIHQWLLSNKLTLNADKTEYMIIGTRQRFAKVSIEINVSIDGKTVKQVYSKKTLGVIIDDKLCWNEQIDNICKKESKGIGMLRRGKPFVSTETLKNFKYVKISKSDRYNLRSNNKMLMLSKPKTNSMKRTFGYIAAKVWNHNKNSNNFD